MTTMTMVMRWRFILCVLALLTGGALLLHAGGMPEPAPAAPAQATYPTPEEAGAALIDAAERFDVEALKHELTSAVPGVVDIHHVHLWALTPERPLITLHARIADDADHDAALQSLQAILAERFGLGHATIQTERGECIETRRSRMAEAHAPHAHGHVHP